MAIEASNSNDLPEIKNYMEVCVRDSLVQVLTSLGVCTCARCRYDIMALALNDLPPKYVVTHKGHIYTKLSALQNQFTVDIITAITQAAGIVSQRPRHDPNDPLDLSPEEF